MMSGRIDLYCRAFAWSTFAVAFVLLSLWLVCPGLSQAENPEGVQPHGRGAEVVVAHGHGLLPGLEKDVTATERRTVAHTAALVDALAELATFLAQPTTTQAGARIIKQYTANVGGLLEIAVKHVMESRTLIETQASVSWPAPSDGGVPHHIVLENWKLVSPSARHLDVYTLLRKVGEAGVTIGAWQVSDQGMVNVAISMPATPQPSPRPASETGLMLLTAEEAKGLLLEEDEWLVPLGKAEEVLGPRITLQQPSVTRAGVIPLIETTSPTALIIAFEPYRAPVDMASLQVRARKGLFKISLTSRLDPYIRGTAIQAQNLQLPAGKFLIEINIADRDGHDTTQKYYIHVIEP